MPLSELRSRTSSKWSRYPDDVLPLWVAEMDVAVCAPVVHAVSDAVRRGDTGYPSGMPYQDAFAEFAERRWGWSTTASRIRLVPDIMQGTVEVIALLTEPGDAVVVNPPVYPPFWAYPRHAGRRIVEAPLGPDHRLDLAALDRAFDEARADGRRAAYLLCHPHNPTGTLHTPDELRAVGELAARHGVRVVSDEVHAPLTLDGTFVSATTVIPDAVALHSASKAFHLAGLKAAIAVPGPEAEHLTHLPELVASEVGHVPVLAHATALREGGSWLDELLTELRAHRTLLAELLAEHAPAVRWTPGAATYFAWLDLRDALPGDPDPARALLRDGRLALNPGPTFGAPGAGHVRLNFATSPELLTEAVRRLASVLPA
ncbi:aminotransferase class I/II-fold pyridoxal phosphate-dependent enzyme [Cellulomonas sp. DKR-3]|uniref:cysteine-S-conjugate beta-lyase n=1 Tax=Cellulomonas fulva TaxID=2835530 RepID=A0ABS5TW85_9CELL|nr:aminotransferase class I/II-fold pyridoxal phosphate-dependent enzyme [Cellulomonas fulva]